MTANGLALRAVDVVKSYGENSNQVLAVNKVSFSVQRGE
jgi:hypothetical protein